MRSPVHDVTADRSTRTRRLCPAKASRGIELPSRPAFQPRRRAPDGDAARSRFDFRPLRSESERADREVITRRYDRNAEEDQPDGRG